MNQPTVEELRGRLASARARRTEYAKIWARVCKHEISLAEALETEPSLASRRVNALLMTGHAIAEQKSAAMAKQLNISDTTIRFREMTPSRQEAFRKFVAEHEAFQARNV